jgi:hypothetical protein
MNEKVLELLGKLQKVAGNIKWDNDEIAECKRVIDEFIAKMSEREHDLEQDKIQMKALLDELRKMDI